MGNHNNQGITDIQNAMQDTVLDTKPMKVDVISKRQSCL